jgi:tetratricopeptide (TPR) repeat protein
MSAPRLAGALIVALGIGSSAAAAGTPSSGGETADPAVDWPVAIARLRQEMHRRPGHALTRQQLAVAYNNYGVELSGQGDLGRAITQMEEAIAVEPDNAQFKKNLAVIYVNQAHAAYEGKQTDASLAALERAIVLAPEVAGAYVLLGDIEYERQHLKEARAAWERARALDPALPDLGERLNRVSQELPVEGAFDKISQAYFDLRFPESVDRSSGFDVRDALLEVRREVGSDFAYWPKYKIVVLMYTPDDFRQLRQETPEWVAGLYDGKIRIPLPGSGINVKQVKETLYHEYTHALVHDVAKGRCPQWFNEGLAVYQETEHGASPGYEQLRDAHGRKALVPWDQLDGQFAWGLPYAEVQLGYQESHSVVRYLAERYGFWRIRRLLAAVAEGEPLTAALTREFHVKLQRLADAWYEWLPSVLGPPP